MTAQNIATSHSHHVSAQGLRWLQSIRFSLLILLCLWLLTLRVFAATPPAPLAVSAKDHPHDRGDAIDVVITLPSTPEVAPEYPVEYVVERCGEQIGIYEKVAQEAPTSRQLAQGEFTIVVSKCVTGEPYWFRVAAIDPGPGGDRSGYVSLATSEPVIATRQYFDGSRFWLLVLTILICSAILGFVLLAWWGMPLKVRQIAGLEAIEEAVGRATEMGKSCIYVPGIQDMNEMQTIAGLTILSRVAERAADYDCQIDVPTSKSLVMTAARDTVEGAYLAAGHPENYNADDVIYVTDDQFAYVSYITGKMVREKPAACFYLGSFFAESLILAETGNAVGAIQIAGTAQPAQLPFFVAACDYTLIGEEFFAASAYLSGAPDQLGSLKGQDAGKILAGFLILVGVGLMTLVQIVPTPGLVDAANYLTETILHAGG